jgi:Xaa-Pro aminopeptidase
VATLPTPELDTCLELEQLIGRPIRPGVVEGPDAQLAEAMIRLRLHHDEPARRELRLAAEATAVAHRAGMRATRPGLRESEVAAAMEAEALRRDLALAYHPIVTVHGEVLHNHAHRHLLGDRDLLLADVGVESPGGFAGDVTRTWPVSGRFSSTQRDLYEVVLAAQRSTIDRVRPGVRYRDLHLHAAREMTRGLVALGIFRGDPDELVAEGVSALLFPHGVGHLLGLDVHDMEDLGDRAGYAPGRSRSKQFGLQYLRLDRDLGPGMAVTIEPGLYIVPAILDHPELSQLAGDRLDRRRLAQFSDVRGIRIEDDVVVTPSGPEVLTASIPKSPDEVEEAMRS